MKMEQILNSLSEDKKAALAEEIATLDELKANGIIAEGEYETLKKKTVDSFILEFKADGEDSETAEPVTGAGGAAKTRKADAFKDSGLTDTMTVPDLANVKGGNLLDSGKTAKKAPKRLADKDTGTGGAMKEGIDELFAGSEFSEEFKVKAAAILEAAVIERTAEVTAVLEEDYKEKFEAEVTALQEKMDEYMDFFVESFLEENKLALESSAKVAVAESFMTALKGLFEEHNVNVDDTEISMVEGLEAKIAELEAELNEAVEKNIEFNALIEEATRDELISEISEGLTDTQKERLSVLAEKISYSDFDEYKTKITTIKESMIVKKKDNAEAFLNEEFVGENAVEEVKLDNVMQSYVSATSKVFRK